MNILFITATRIGDAILSTGVLAELNRRHPDASITVACGPLAASLFAGFPGVAEVIEMTKRPLAGHWFDLWRRTVGRHWDLIVDLRRSLTSYFLSARERRRLGPTDDSRHRAEFLPSVIGLNRALDPVIPGLDPAAPRRVNIVAVAPVAARADKTWPIERFVELVRRLRAGPCRDAAVAVVGGADDARAIASFTALGVDVLRWIANPDLKAVAAQLRRTRLYVGNDSGVSHLAAAAGAPTVALFGPTEPRNYAPRGLCVRVVRAPLRDGRRTMNDVSVDDVFTAAAELLASLPTMRH